MVKNASQCYEQLVIIENYLCVCPGTDLGFSRGGGRGRIFNFFPKIFSAFSLVDQIGFTSTPRTL